MEDMTVVSFFVDREGIAWDKEWKFRVENVSFANDSFRFVHTLVALPFWEREDTMWKRDRQKEYLQRLPIPVEGRRTCYVCDKEVSILYGMKTGNLGLDWGLFLLDFYKFSFDGVVIFEDREINAQELVLRFAPNLAYVGVVTSCAWRWEEVEEYISQEYGYQIEVMPTFTKLHLGKGRLLLWSGENIRGLTPLTMPLHSIWLDGAQWGKRMGFETSLRKKKVKRLDIEKFLHDFAEKSCIVREIKV